MSGTVLDHWLVRGYLRELDAVLRGLPAAQARELKEQISAHLDDALGPDAGDYEVAATLSRLGSPADLAAEAGAASGSSGPRPAAVVRLTQNLEDERDLSAAYTARPRTGPVPLTVVRARRATDAAAATVRAQASGIGPGYQPATIRALGDLLTARVQQILNASKAAA